MCLPSAPKLPPSPPERQAAQQPMGDIRTRQDDINRRRRGYQATMFANTSAPASTSNVLGA